MRQWLDWIYPNPYRLKIAGKKIEDCDRQDLIDYYTFEANQNDRFGTPKGENPRWFPVVNGGIMTMPGKESRAALYKQQLMLLSSGSPLTREHFGWSKFSED